MIAAFLATWCLAVISLIGWMRAATANRWLRAERDVYALRHTTQVDPGDVAIRAAYLETEDVR